MAKFKYSFSQEPAMHPAWSGMPSIHSPAYSSHRHKCSFCVEDSLLSLMQNKLI